MILGMARGKYDYDPDASRQSATGEQVGSIPADLQKYGLALDPDTIRNYLREAWEQFGVDHPTSKDD